MKYKLIITPLFEATEHEQKVNDFLQGIGEVDIYTTRTFKIDGDIYTEILHDKQSIHGNKVVSNETQ